LWSCWIIRVFVTASSETLPHIIYLIYFNIWIKKCGQTVSQTSPMKFCSCYRSVRPGSLYLIRYRFHEYLKVFLEVWDCNGREPLMLNGDTPAILSLWQARWCHTTANKCTICVYIITLYIYIMYLCYACFKKLNTCKRYTYIYIRIYMSAICHEFYYNNVWYVCVNMQIQTMYIHKNCVPVSYSTPSWRVPAVTTAQRSDRSVIAFPEGLHQSLQEINNG
jgi:hypothetical protein